MVRVKVLYECEVFEFVSHANLSVKVYIKRNYTTVLLLTLLWLTDIKCTLR
jgi:hypothetical protein